jgi:hypothetical protein
MKTQVAVDGTFKSSVNNALVIMTSIKPYDKTFGKLGG